MTSWRAWPRTSRASSPRPRCHDVMQQWASHGDLNVDKQQYQAPPTSSTRASSLAPRSVFFSRLLVIDCGLRPKFGAGHRKAVLFACLTLVGCILRSTSFLLQFHVHSTVVYTCIVSSTDEADFGQAHTSQRRPPCARTMLYHKCYSEGVLRLLSGMVSDIVAEGGVRLQCPTRGVNIESRP